MQLTDGSALVDSCVTSGGDYGAHLPSTTATAAATRINESLTSCLMSLR